ncbi:COG3014 family protein [Vibrio alfacsensis]|uniref:COG3014 family protein n=1 Tax=Vibrio alfacsensis TaxID=1074311 RepID=UPI004068D497
MKHGVTLFAIICWSFASTGCANLSAGNLFSHYSDQNKEVYQAVVAGEYAKAEQLQSNNAGGDILGNFEQGRISFLAEDYSTSLSSLEVSDRAVRKQQERAMVSVTETATSVGSLAVNDNLNEYQPADYELGFLHLYLGLNYLHKNDLEGALVEVRRANQVQEAAKKARERELKQAEQDLKNQGMSANLGSVLANYPDAGNKLSAVQNGYLFYLSGLLYEASRDLNSAYVDYRRALAVMPDNKQVIESTMYAAKKLGMRQDLRLLEKRYGKAPTALSKNQGRVIILDEQGVVEALQGWRIDLPIYDSRGNGAIYSLALPYYPRRGSQKFADMTLNGNRLPSSTLVDVNAMAQNEFQERLMSIVVRQAMRVWTKDRMRKEAAKGDDVGNLLFNVWNTLTEQPDTRSWQTLPGQVKTASQVVQSGKQSLNIGDQVYQFEVPMQQTTLVWVSRQGSHSTVWHKQLGRL